MSILTKDEAAWVKKVQTLLNKCPSKRLGFYTVGDADVMIYDKSKDVDRINGLQDRDFCHTVQDLDAGLGRIVFHSNVHSTAG